MNATKKNILGYLIYDSSANHRKCYMDAWGESHSSDTIYDGAELFETKVEAEAEAKKWSDWAIVYEVEALYLPEGDEEE